MAATKIDLINVKCMQTIDVNVVWGHSYEKFKVP